MVPACQQHLRFPFPWVIRCVRNWQVQGSSGEDPPRQLPPPPRFIVSDGSLFVRRGSSTVSPALQGLPEDSLAGVLARREPTAAVVGVDEHQNNGYQVWPSPQTLVGRFSFVAYPSLKRCKHWQWWMSLPRRPRDFKPLRKHLQTDQPLLETIVT